MITKTFDELLAETLEVMCPRCHGHTSYNPGSPNYCGTCRGRGEVTVNRYSLLTDEQRVEVLERELSRLRPDLAAKYPRRHDERGEAV